MNPFAAFTRHFTCTGFSITLIPGKHWLGLTTLFGFISWTDYPSRSTFDVSKYWPKALIKTELKRFQVQRFLFSSRACWYHYFCMDIFFHLLSGCCLSYKFYVKDLTYNVTKESSYWIDLIFFYTIHYFTRGVWVSYFPRVTFKSIRDYYHNNQLSNKICPDF